MFGAFPFAAPTFADAPEMETPTPPEPTATVKGWAVRSRRIPNRPPPVPYPIFLARLEQAKAEAIAAEEQEIAELFTLWMQTRN